MTYNIQYYLALGKKVLRRTLWPENQNCYQAVKVAGVSPAIIYSSVNRLQEDILDLEPRGPSYVTLRIAASSEVRVSHGDPINPANTLGKGVKVRTNDE